MACSKVGSAVGWPSHTNLECQRSKGQKQRFWAYRMSAETLSKQYWLNLGLLGFRLISPRILTRRFRIASWDGMRA